MSIEGTQAQRQDPRCGTPLEGDSLGMFKPPSLTWSPLAAWGESESDAPFQPAPGALLQPAAAWLSGMASPAIAHLELPLRLFRLFCDLNLRPQAPSVPGDPVLMSPGDPLVSEIHLNQWIDLFRARPEAFLPEVTGFTLAHLKGPWFWGESTRRTREAEALWALRGPHEQQVIQGALLYQAAYRAIAAERKALQERPPPQLQDRIIAIIKDKLPGAIGHHGHLYVDGQSLDEWLLKAETQPERLLDALKASPFISSQAPKKSRLIAATDFGGPMFGVFSKEEVHWLEQWTQEPGKAWEPSLVSALPQTTVPPLMAPPAETESPPSADRKTPRALYTALLNAESTRPPPPAARATIETMLRKARWLQAMGLGPAPRSYSRPALDQLLERAEAKTTSPSRDRNPSVDRPFCRWVIQQLAPAILVDGAWLSGIPGLQGGVDSWDLELIQILVDELGDGRDEWHHGNVYRSLLRKEGIALPDFRTPAFSENPMVLTSAFTLPVLLLAFGLEAKNYRPEILGLNLAIEFSGLGSSYQKAIRILEKNQMDPTILRLHLSIDNRASGHAGRACRALVLFLDEVKRLEGEAGCNRAWQRVLHGYLSLQVATLNLSLQILMRYGLYRMGFKRLAGQQVPCKA